MTMGVSDSSDPVSVQVAAIPSKAKPASKRGEVDTVVRKILKDDTSSSWRKYMTLVVGQKSFWALFKYELLTGLLGSIPGAAGLLLRQKFYRCLLGSCGSGVAIGRNVTIRHPHRIHLGDRVIIDDNCVLDAKGEDEVTVNIGNDSIIGRNTILSCKGGRIEIAPLVNVSVNCTFISETSLRIGTKVLIAGYCYVVAGGNHGIDRTDVPILEQPVLDKGGVDIAEHCWVGASVTILDGVTIGCDAVVAAGAVVTRAVDPFSIVGGVPARVLNDRRGTASEGSR